MRTLFFVLAGMLSFQTVHANDGVGQCDLLIEGTVQKSSSWPYVLYPTNGHSDSLQPIVTTDKLGVPRKFIAMIALDPRGKLTVRLADRDKTYRAPGWTFDVSPEIARLSVATQAGGTYDLAFGGEISPERDTTIRCKLNK